MRHHVEGELKILGWQSGSSVELLPSKLKALNSKSSITTTTKRNYLLMF
jgi:hypothetical protein